VLALPSTAPARRRDPVAPCAEEERRQPRGCSTKTFTAPGFELAPVAVQAARVCVQTLLAGEPGGYPDATADATVVRLRGPAGPLDAPAWSGHALPVHDGCAYCAQAAHSAGDTHR